MGLLEGLVFALDLGFKRNKVNTDFSEIAMEINQGRTKRSDGLEMLRKIKSMLSQFDEAVVSHTFREVNFCAEALVKVGCRLSMDMYCFSTAPSFIEHLLFRGYLKGLHL